MKKVNKVNKVETKREIMGYVITDVWTAETLTYKFYENVQMLELKDIIKKNGFSMKCVEVVDYDKEELFMHIIVDPTIGTESWDICNVRGE